MRARSSDSPMACRNATTSPAVGHPDEGDSLAPGADLTSDSDSAIIDARNAVIRLGLCMGSGWLQVAPNATAPPDGSDVGEIIRWYRVREGLSQQAVAAGCTPRSPSCPSWRRARRSCGTSTSCDASPGNSASHPNDSACCPTTPAMPTRSPRTSASGPDRGRDSQEHWREVRGQLNTHRAMLGDLAAELYPKQQRVPGTTVLTSADWMPSGPVDLTDVTLIWRTTAPTPTHHRQRPGLGLRPTVDGQRQSLRPLFPRPARSRPTATARQSHQLSPARCRLDRQQGIARLQLHDLLRRARRRRIPRARVRRGLA